MDFDPFTVHLNELIQKADLGAATNGMNQPSVETEKTDASDGDDSDKGEVVL